MTAGDWITLAEILAAVIGLPTVWQMTASRREVRRKRKRKPRARFIDIDPDNPPGWTRHGDWQ